MNTFQITILESPAPKDFLDDRHEGRTLCAALHHAGMDAKVYTVVGKSILLDAMSVVVQRIFKRVPGVLPILHLSMHGNADGVVLTDGYALPWAELAEWLELVNTHAKGHLLVVLSTCSGFNGMQMTHSLVKKEVEPFFALVGPKEAIAWEDTVAAFVCLYHHIRTKEGTVLGAIPLMNSLIGRSEQPLFYAARAEDERKAYREKTIEDIAQWLERKRAELDEERGKIDADIALLRSAKAPRTAQPDASEVPALSDHTAPSNGSDDA